MADFSLGVRVGWRRPGAVIENLERANELGMAAAAAGIKKMARSVLSHAKGLVPVDQGPLRRSGHVVAPTTNSRNRSIEVQVVFDAKNPVNGYGYAEIQHENLNYHHDFGEAKYLEKAIDAHRDQIDQLGRDVKDKFEKAGNAVLTKGRKK